MKAFLIVIGVLALLGAVSMFASNNGKSVVVEIESFIAFLIATTALAGAGIVGAVEKLQAETVRVAAVTNLARIEQAQRQT